VAATGGTPIAVTTVDTAGGENSHRWPYFLPDGNSFLYYARGPGAAVYMATLSRPQEKIKLFPSATSAVYAPGSDDRSGHLLWVRDGTLLAQPFDPVSHRMAGTPFAIAENVEFNGAGRLAVVSSANDGTLLYGEGTSGALQLKWYDRDGRTVGLLGPLEPYVSFRLSPDGSSVAFVSGADVWRMDVRRAVATRLTYSSLVPGRVVWSPDGHRLVFARGGPPNLFALNADGTGPEERLISTHDGLDALDWSPDGRYVLFSANSNDLPLTTRADLWALPMFGDRKAFPIATTPFVEARAQFSPDGKWLVYAGNESGQYEIYVRPFPQAGAKVRISSHGGDYPKWTQNGREILFLGADGQLMTAAAHNSDAAPQFDVPKPLFPLAQPFATSAAITLAPHPYDVTRDGDRILAVESEANRVAPSLMVLMNWRPEPVGTKAP
jgi:dipeptidyl aminopeptidase/acylaminoacyl peptidase